MHSVNSCLCGYNLRAGTLILLSLGVLFSLYSLLQIFLYVSNPFFYFYSYVSFDMIIILLPIIWLSFSITGIYGVLKKKPSYLLPYLGLQVLGLVAGLIAMVVVFISAPYTMANRTISFSHVFAKILYFEYLLLICEGITYYFFVVVLSYYKELRSGSLLP